MVPISDPIVWLFVKVQFPCVMYVLPVAPCGQRYAIETVLVYVQVMWGRDKQLL